MPLIPDGLLPPNRRRKSSTISSLSVLTNGSNNVTETPPLDESSSPGDQEEQEEIARKNLFEKVIHLLNEARFEDKRLQFKSEATIYNVIEDIEQMSADEPCGHRGCHLFLAIELPPTNAEQQQKVIHNLGSIRIDEETVPTFEMQLTLRPIDGSGLKDWILGWSPTWVKQFVGADAICVSDCYRLSKRRLYSNGDA